MISFKAAVHIRHRLLKSLVVISTPVVFSHHLPRPEMTFPKVSLLGWYIYFVHRQEMVPTAPICPDGFLAAVCMVSAMHIYWSHCNFCLKEPVKTSKVDFLSSPTSDQSNHTSYCCVWLFNILVFSEKQNNILTRLIKTKSDEISTRTFSHGLRYLVLGDLL